MAERFFKKEEEEEGYSEPCDEEEEEEEVEYTRKKVMIRVVSAGQRMSSLVPFMNYSSDSSSSSTSTSYSNSNSGSSRISIGSLRCQADECGVDLRMAKTYHKRHKVCERHAKAAVVLVSGIRQRFCQQCSKFHEISQFDDNKKSCREKLAGHNERRRKTHSDLQEEDKEKPPASSIMNGNLLKALRYSNYGEKSLQGNSNMKHCRIK